MRHHSVLNLSPEERVKKCRFSNTNKNQNCAKIALGKNTILLGFGYSTFMFTSKQAPRKRLLCVKNWPQSMPSGARNSLECNQLVRCLTEKKIGGTNQWQKPKTKTISSKQNLKKAVHTRKSVNTKEIRLALIPMQNKSVAMLHSELCQAIPSQMLLPGCEWMPVACKLKVNDVWVCLWLLHPWVQSLLVPLLSALQAAQKLQKQK